jgi:SAM-dependent methyltransferase
LAAVGSTWQGLEVVGPHEQCGYTFGDTDVAAERLALVAEVFDATSAALLSTVASGPVDLAIDLGCGPGHTTALLAAQTGARRTVGLDSSPTFVARARDAGTRGLEFVEHDVTRTPFPVTRADVMYGRYLLAHLANPTSLIERWVAELRPGGRLVLEEVEAIATDDAAFRRYLAVVADLLASRGTDLYVGRVLRDAPTPAGTTLVTSMPAETTPPTSKVAAMFAMNLATWRNDPWVAEHVRADELARLAQQIDDRRSTDSHGAITWTHRQVVYERLP